MTALKEAAGIFMRKWWSPVFICMLMHSEMEETPERNPLFLPQRCTEAGGLMTLPVLLFIPAITNIICGFFEH